tara:strand:+ start:583 stop:813 length:231 start_codon:yes stop_codon:yes gene_type:complete
LKNLIFLILSIFLLNNCSFNKNSKFWTEDNNDKIAFKKKLIEINTKSNNITSLSFNEYEIYIEEYAKKQKYPDISK